ncbi:peptide-methionine (S)-S-oxide reductase MsrA [Thorsellia anophelis]|uniref:Peptide methionine sulfoxide reductase MsrA n=1 Tax=Thorsellia anophelis DSM 18579 TaxID=1123402 RepID=A0A1I0DXY6_9GAMM|nr:peptide-methionine (S)-S-oxide reductase MsrA [Thorsellia anophelis]SET36744.1 peptide-methionine (S)-S-oxide reductase [Thorsellia anophelis DSM 18579]
MATIDKYINSNARTNYPYELPIFNAISRVNFHEIDRRFNFTTFGMGCFWGVERLFWKLPGVYVTMVGYSAGTFDYPTYEEVCTGQTGHAEVVRIYFDDSKITFASLLKNFWENHDPTQGMQQGNDIGSQYRSLIICKDEEQMQQAETSYKAYSEALAMANYGKTITTEILPQQPFYFAEPYHQQYLFKNPNGYCGLGGTGICLL